MIGEFSITCPRCGNKVGDCVAKADRYSMSVGDANNVYSVRMVDVLEINCAECGLTDDNIGEEETEDVKDQLTEEE